MKTSITKTLLMMQSVKGEKIGVKHELLIWIIDEEWPDYEEEKKILLKRYPEADIRFSGYDFEKDLNEFGYRADIILTQIYASITAETINKLA